VASASRVTLSRPPGSSTTWSDVRTAPRIAADRAWTMRGSGVGPASDRTRSVRGAGAPAGRRARCRRRPVRDSGSGATGSPRNAAIARSVRAWLSARSGSTALAPGASLASLAPLGRSLLGRRLPRLRRRGVARAGLWTRVDPVTVDEPGADREQAGGVRVVRSDGSPRVATRAAPGLPRRPMIEPRDSSNQRDVCRNPEHEQHDEDVSGHGKQF
jgi:hypothetical protein